MSRRQASTVAAAALAAASLAGCAARRSVWWGDVHGHTEESDGRGTVAEYFRHARHEAGLDFAIVTDHDFGNGPPWSMSAEAWGRTQDAADAANEDGAFVAIAGYEWTSQPKYWSGPGESEHLFDGTVRDYNHANVYFPHRVPAPFSSKDPAYRSPDLLASAVARAGGLAHRNHPSPAAEGQWDHTAASARIIANTEIGPDVTWHEGVRYEPGTERAVRRFLAAGGRAGFVGGSDTHLGRPEARTAVFARRLTRADLFDGLRARRCYAVSGARIRLDFRVNGAPMGSEVRTDGEPRLRVRVRGTDRLAQVEVIRDGEVLHSLSPRGRTARLRFTDESFPGSSWYHVRVTQADSDAHGNPSRAWSSPIWVSRPGAVATDPKPGIDSPP